MYLFKFNDLRSNTAISFRGLLKLLLAGSSIRQGGSNGVGGFEKSLPIMLVLA